jgi:hypothetical protein
MQEGAEPQYETGVLRTMTSLPLVFEAAQEPGAA